MTLTTLIIIISISLLIGGVLGYKFCMTRNYVETMKETCKIQTNIISNRYTAEEGANRLEELYQKEFGDDYESILGI